MYCTPSVKVYFNDVYKTKLSFMIRSESNVYVEEEKKFPPSPHLSYCFLTYLYISKHCHKFVLVRKIKFTEYVVFKK